jgi:predicted DNA-binding transcriptional regulator AlpA
MAKTDENSLTKQALLVSADQAARLLGLSRAHFYSQLSAGRIGPMGYEFGRRKLWSVEELRRWVESGCPPREKWLQGYRGKPNGRTNRTRTDA